MQKSSLSLLSNPVNHTDVKRGIKMKEENVIVRLSQGEQRTGTVWTSGGVSTFKDGKWSYTEFTPLLRVRSYKLKESI